MLKETLEKFNYPESLVKEYEHWIVLLRPAQPTLGSLVLVCKDDVGKFSEVSEESFQEYSGVIRDIESSLTDLFQYHKINYLMLMMVDPAVHYHVIPRYAEDKVYEGVTFKDYGWPAIPKLLELNEVSSDVQGKLLETLKGKFNS